MRHIVAILLVFLAASCSFAQSPNMDFIPVTANIQESILPVARGEKYGQPLDTFLREQGLGEVTGGGTSLGKDGMPNSVEISFDLRDPEKNASAVASKLKDLGAPIGSSLQYWFGGQMRTVPVQ